MPELQVSDRTRRGGIDQHRHHVQSAFLPQFVNPERGPARPCIARVARLRTKRRLLLRVLGRGAARARGTPCPGTDRRHAMHQRGGPEPLVPGRLLRHRGALPRCDHPGGGESGRASLGMAARWQRALSCGDDTGDDAFQCAPERGAQARGALEHRSCILVGPLPGHVDRLESRARRGSVPRLGMLRYRNRGWQPAQS